MNTNVVTGTRFTRHTFSYTCRHVAAGRRRHHSTWHEFLSLFFYDGAVLHQSRRTTVALTCPPCHKSLQQTLFLVSLWERQIQIVDPRPTNNAVVNQCPGVTKAVLSCVICLFRKKKRDMLRVGHLYFWNAAAIGFCVTVIGLLFKSRCSK